MFVCTHVLGTNAEKSLTSNLQCLFTPCKMVLSNISTFIKNILKNVLLVLFSLCYWDFPELNHPQLLNGSKCFPPIMQETDML